MKMLRVLSLISGILLVIIGVVLLSNPLYNVVGLALIVSFSILFFGIAEIIMFFTNQYQGRSWWILVSGVVSVLLGLWALLDKGALQGMIIALPVLFAVWMFVAGILRIIGAFSARNIGEAGWGIILLMGILGIILAAVLLFNPLFSAEVLGTVIAMMFMYQGISAIVQFFVLRKM